VSGAVCMEDESDLSSHVLGGVVGEPVRFRFLIVGSAKTRVNRAGVGARGAGGAFAHRGGVARGRA
jgi:hypothetical protein